MCGGRAWSCSRKSPNHNCSHSGEDQKEVKQCIPSTRVTAESCRSPWDVQLRGGPSSLREAKPLLEDGKPHLRFALSPPFQEVPHFPFSLLGSFLEIIQHRVFDHV